MLDVVIRGADVVDGTGTPRRRADLGISDGAIVAIGRISDAAHRTVDADGLVLAPGFVDVHTHFDAQVFWDPYLTPSCFHGMTTVIAGNCGFSVAPLAPEHGEYLMSMLARVEGMPLEALQQGVPWDWTSTSSYLDRLDGTLAVNAGFMVGHSAVRRVVMGEDSVRRHATDAEVATMTQVLGQSLAAGGLGLSSSWATTHVDADGEPVPSRHGSEDELLTLCRVVGDHPGTILEFIPVAGGPAEPVITDLIARMSLAANRSLNWNVLVPDADDTSIHEVRLGASDYATAKGATVLALTTPDVIRFRISFLSGFVLDSFPGWPATMTLPPEEKLRALSTPDHRRKLDAAAHSPSLGARVRLADWPGMRIAETFSPETARYRGWTVGQVASEQGKDPFDVMCDLVVADRLRTSFAPPPVGDDDATWKLRASLWSDPRVLLGASDAGAHVESIATFNYATALLGESVRDRGLLSLEDAVRLLTDVPARVYGLRGRGRIAEGACADLVLFDETTIAPGAVETRWDLPAGAPRLYSEPTGVQAVFVNGTEIVHANQVTGALSGTVLRSGRDTVTVPIPAGTSA